jgi:hypothetical protein
MALGFLHLLVHTSCRSGPIKRDVGVALNWTVVVVTAVQATTAILSAAIGAVISYKWGQKALALKDGLLEMRAEALASKNAQFELVQRLNAEMLKAKDAQIEHWKQLTVPSLVDHFQSLTTIYEQQMPRLIEHASTSDDLTSKTERASTDLEVLLVENRDRLGQLIERLDAMYPIMNRIDVNALGLVVTRMDVDNYDRPSPSHEQTNVQLALLALERGRRRRAALIDEMTAVFG